MATLRLVVPISSPNNSPEEEYVCPVRDNMSVKKLICSENPLLA
jgi:hypothetical protein